MRNDIPDDATHINPITGLVYWKSQTTGKWWVFDYEEGEWVYSTWVWKTPSELIPIIRKDDTPIPTTSSGTDNDYWLIFVKNPKRLDPYTAEAEDLIEALDMSFQEGEAFKALIRKCKARMGDGKPGDDPLRNAEKVAHYGTRMVAIETRRKEDGCNNS